jgi:hypothetical protein
MFENQRIRQSAAKPRIGEGSTTIPKGSRVVISFYYSKREDLVISINCCIFDYSLTKIRSMKQLKIYSLNCPIKKEVRYVGVTSGTLSNRLSQHVYSGKKRMGSTVSKWIRHLLEQNKRPTIHLIEEIPFDKWEEKEKYWISFFKEKNNLLNQHVGGQGVVVNRSKTSIDRSAESKFKKVCQCNDDYKLIKIWDSTKTAASILNISRASIYKCLEQKYNTNVHAGGFKWVKKELFDNNSFIKKYKIPNGKRRDCVQIIKKDLFNNTIEIFESKEKLSKDLGIPRHVLDRKLKKEKFVFNEYIYEILKKI